MGCKDIEIRKSESVAKTQLSCRKISNFRKTKFFSFFSLKVLTKVSKLILNNIPSQKREVQVENVQKLKRVTVFKKIQKTEFFNY